MLQTTVVAGLLLLSVMPPSNGQINYTIHTDETDWISASKLCSLATPTINFTPTVNNTVDFGVSDLHLETGKEYWIGYQKNQQIFKYEGCAPIPSGQTYNYLLRSIPGLCFSACSLRKFKYFGLRGTDTDNDKAECFCLADKPDELQEKGCNRNSLDMQFTYPLVLSGGLNHISVYSTATTLNISHVVPHPNPVFKGHCVTYENIDKNSPKWYWTGCGRSLHPLCEPVTTENVNLWPLVKYENENINWRRSAGFCLNQEMLPSSISYNFRHYITESLKIPSPSWTAFFRDNLLYIPDTGVASSGSSCAFVEVREDQMPVLRFRSCITEKKINSICQKGMRIETTVQSSSMKISTKLSSATTGGTADMTTPSVTRRAALQGDNISLIVPIVVGVICGILLLIAIIIVVICCRKRNERKHQEAVKKCIPELENYSHQITNMDYAVVDKFRSNANNANNDTNIAYNNIEDNTPNGVMIAGQSADYSEVPDIEDTDCYNHINSNNNDPSMGNTENVYNKLNAQDENDSYDVSGTNTKLDTKQNGDLYNELDSQNAKDMYDRTNDCNVDKTKNTDQFYDHAKFDKGADMYDVTTDCKKEVNEPDAVYSRVIKENRID